MEKQQKRAATTAGLVACLAGLPSAAQAATKDPNLPNRPRQIGDLFLVDQYDAPTGTSDSNNVDWMCRPGGQAAQMPANTNKLCYDSSSPVVFGQFWNHINSLGPNKQPELLRAGKARSRCVRFEGPVDCGTGVPVTTACTPADPASTPYCALRSLKDRGIKLGVVIGARELPENEQSPGRNWQDILWQACKVQEADTAELYDFVFLDQAHTLGSNLNLTVRNMRDGRYVDGNGDWKNCAPGWDVMTNDNQWNAGGGNNMSPYAWGHAKHFDNASDRSTMLRVANDSSFPAITSADQNFISAVNNLPQPDGVTTGPVLRFEVPRESSILAGIGKDDQCKVLSRFAKNETQFGYEPIFPLFDQGLQRSANDADGPYDSYKEGTALKQMYLIGNPDDGAACR